MRPAFTPLALLAGLALPGTTLAQNGAPALSRSLDQQAASAPVFADELPGYYAFYKRAGDSVRLDEEVSRDAEMAEGDRWTPVVVDQPLPQWSLPNGLGTKVPVRSGNAGRLTVITTFQAWW